MTAGDLKRLLKDVPDDTPVLTPGQDHSYMVPTAGEAFALLENGKHWTEYYDETYTPETKWDKKFKVFIVG
jgi:hypothetical protein